MRTGASITSGTYTFVTLGDLGAMAKRGRDSLVYDAKTGADITRSVLTHRSSLNKKTPTVHDSHSGPPPLSLDFVVNRLRHRAFSHFAKVLTYAQRARVWLLEDTRHASSAASSDPQGSVSAVCCDNFAGAVVDGSTHAAVDRKQQTIMG
jgi:hypothetical protein